MVDKSIELGTKFEITTDAEYDSDSSVARWRIENAHENLEWVLRLGFCAIIGQLAFLCVGVEAAWPELQQHFELSMGNEVELRLITMRPEIVFLLILIWPMAICFQIAFLIFVMVYSKRQLELRLLAIKTTYYLNRCILRLNQSETVDEDTNQTD